MKIAVVAPSHIPARRANTVQVMKMSAALAALGHDLRLFAPEQPGPGEPTSEAALREHYGLECSFPLEWLPAASNGRRYDYGWRAFQRARQWGADLLYTRLPQAAALGSLSGLPTVFEVHDYPLGRTGPLLFRLFLRGRGKRRLVAITRALANDLSARLGAPSGPPFTQVAPDGVDLQRYRDLPPPEEARLRLAEAGLRLPVGRFTAGYTGHLYAGRGLELLLALAGRLPEVSFLLAGGEPEEVHRVQAEVQERNLANVILTGFVPNAALPLYQAASDVLLMPYEQRVAASSGGDIARYLSPMKLFEYLASGRAILSSDLPVLQEVLTPHSAVLLPPGETEAWAGALLELQADPERRLRLGEQARREARHYTWEGRAQTILEGLEA